MEIAALVPVDEYLASSYSPDVDYDEGRLIERNAGKWKHSRLQYLIAQYVGSHESAWGVLGFTEQRIRVKEGKFCIADVCAVRTGHRYETVLTSAPLFTIEILSEDDAFSEVEGKARKYLDMGVEYVWTVDPETGRCYRHTSHSMDVVPDSVLRAENPPVAIPIGELLKKIEP